MSWLSTVRGWFSAPERALDLSSVSGADHPRGPGEAPAVGENRLAVLVDTDGDLSWAVTRVFAGETKPSHTILIEGDERPYHHIRDHGDVWVYRRM